MSRQPAVGKGLRFQGKLLPRWLEPGFVPSEEIDPESMRELIAAVLSHAVSSFRAAKGPGRRKQILAWFESKKKSYPFDFTVICDLLGLPRDAILKKLLTEEKATSRRHGQKKRAGSGSMGLISEPRAYPVGRESREPLAKSNRRV